MAGSPAFSQQMETMGDPGPSPEPAPHGKAPETMSFERLDLENKQLREERDKLIRQNAKLLLLLKDRESKLTDAEIIIRKYRSRLVRWFEDMKYDPFELENETRSDE